MRLTQSHIRAVSCTYSEFILSVNVSSILNKMFYCIQISLFSCLVQGSFLMIKINGVIIDWLLCNICEGFRVMLLTVLINCSTRSVGCHVPRLLYVQGIRLRCWRLQQYLGIRTFIEHDGVRKRLWHSYSHKQKCYVWHQLEHGSGCEVSVSCSKYSVWG